MYETGYVIRNGSPTSICITIHWPAEWYFLHNQNYNSLDNATHLFTLKKLQLTSFQIVLEKQCYAYKLVNKKAYKRYSETWTRAAPAKADTTPMIFMALSSRSNKVGAYKSTFIFTETAPLYKKKGKQTSQSKESRSKSSNLTWKQASLDAIYDREREPLMHVGESWQNNH
jgi:hypothetical protein